MTQSVYTITKVQVYLEDTPLAAAGGEGSVYRVISTGTFVNSCVKIFHPPKRTQARRDKIEFMIKNKPQVLSSTSYVICWPTEMIFDNNGSFLGFLMDLAFSGSVSLYELTRTKTPKQLQQHWDKFDRSLQSGIEKRLKICVNIAIAVHSIHLVGNYAIVDFKPQNILITNDGKISITDVDSFQIANNGVVIFHSEVATPEYAPPESAKINPSQSLIVESWDRFSLAVSFYEILFGIHPFAASCDGQFQIANTIGEKIQNGLFVHGSKKNYLSIIPSIHNNFQHLPASLSRLFITAFEEGHTNYNARPTAEQWGNAIYAELTTKTGIKANTISIPQQIIVKASSSTVTSTVPRYYPPTVSPVIPATNNNKSTILWVLLAILGVIGLIYFISKPALKEVTYIAPSTSSIINRTGYINANEYANIRNGPSTNNGIIIKKYRGESVFVLEKDLATGWYKLRYDNYGNTGYVSDKLISFVAVSPRSSNSNEIPSNNVPQNAQSKSSNVTPSEQTKHYKLITCTNCNGHGEINAAGTCGQCYGTGGILCPKCNGGSKIGCDKCNGEKKIACISCDGQGSYNCRGCGGLGYFECRSCGGSGIMRGHSCQFCGGKGKRPCLSCNQAGKIPCRRCNRTGYLQCSSCNQTGYIPCRNCRNGTIKCSTCNGLGHVTGTTSCPRCEGKGQIQVEI